MCQFYGGLQSSKHLYPLIEIHGNTNSIGAGGPAEKDLGRHRLKIDPRRYKNNKNLISLTMKVSLKRLMIRNPKDFGVWSACPCGVHSVITELETISTIIAMGFSSPDKGFIQRVRYSSTLSFFGGSEAGFCETRIAMSGSFKP